MALKISQSQNTKKPLKGVYLVATRHDLSVIVENVGSACHSLFGSEAQ
jgi:hypothetical protein